MGFKHGGLELAHGNTKLGKDTVILNMGSARNCPSKKLGFCKIEDRCYAAKAETQYPNVRDYRARQEIYWKKTDHTKLINDFESIIIKHSRAFEKIFYLRFNESGDFWSQKCVVKLDYFAQYLRNTHRIITYGYTAREDLIFNKTWFLVKGSSNNAGNNGKTIVRNKNKIKVGAGHWKYYNETENGKRKTYFICPADCFGCKMCKELNFQDIVFTQH